MPRGYGRDYSFVIDSSFTPFTMQEMLVPFTAYKEAYEQDQAAYEDLTTKADVFKDLSQSLPEGSEARRIYEGYANDLKAQANDLTQNGLTMSGRSALRNLKRRYTGEIGMLDRANEALKKERELRRQMSAKDPSMLYAVNPEELNIDQFLGGKTPSLYGVSGTELYTKAAAASQAASKRQFSVNGDSKTLGGYYYDYVQRMGYNPQTIAQFRRDMSAIPELQQAADDILMANGVTDNLSGRALEQARQQVINGMIDGAVYSEQHNPQRNLGVMTAAEVASDARAREGQAIQRANASRAQQQLELSALQSGYKRENGKWVLDEEGIQKRAEMMGIGSYNPDEWEVGPDGKVRRKPKTSTDQKSSEEKIREKKDDALLKLDKTTLKNERGFDVSVGKERQHYDYIAALVHNPKQNKWYSGHLGEDFKGHNGIALWSDVNVVNRLGNYSVTRWKDKADRRVLAGNEVAALANNQDIANSIEDELIKSNLYTERTIQGVMSEYKLPREKAVEQLEKNGYKYISDYQLVAVKNDEGDDDYLIAVRTK